MRMSRSPVRPRRFVPLAALLLLLVLILRVALSTRQSSPSWDEGDHIFSGYMNWMHGDYDLNPEHPPLVKLVATLPLVPLHLKIAPRQGRFFKSEAYYGGRELLFRNDPRFGGQYRASTLLFRVHMAVLGFAVLLALLLFFAGREMFGSVAGLVAMALFVFDPTVLANAPFVTTDMGAACGFFATVYMFYRFVKQRTWARAVWCGVVLGLALTTKHSMAALVPLLLLLTAGEMLLQRNRHGQEARRRTEMQRLLFGIVLLFFVAWVVLWGVYSFRYAMHPQAGNGLELPPLARQTASVGDLTRGVVTVCARFHLLPESYLYGLMDVERVGKAMPTFFLGKVYAHGQWFYFPVLLSLKWSVGLLGLLLVTIFALFTGSKDHVRDLLFLLLPSGFYLALAMASPLNIGVRHVLPLFPFAFALAGAGAALLVKQHKAWAYVVGVLLCWHIADSLRMFPNYLPYANALWGGPAKTHLYFSDSATDWGQQLQWTKQWLDREHVPQCWFAYFPAPFLLPSDYGIPCRLLPTADTESEMAISIPAVVHGPVLISFADLNGFELGTKVRNPYGALFLRRPDAVIANGIAVFKGDFRLPEAAALQYEQRSRELLAKDPQRAVDEARQGLLLAPDSFDGNLALGDGLAALGQKRAATLAYARAGERLVEMEPEAQTEWRQVLKTKDAALH